MNFLLERLRVFFLSLIFIGFVFVKNGFSQNSSAIQSIPNAPSVNLDTLFLTPDKTFPFDRYFILKYSDPDKIKVKGFSVTPIDLTGKRKVNKRDYRLYSLNMTKGEPRESLRKFKQEHSWWAFKHTKDFAGKIYSEHEEYPSGKGTGIALKIPPLDPGRAYRVSVIYVKESFGDEFISLIPPLTNIFIEASKVNVEQFQKFKNLYGSINSKSQFFYPNGLDEYFSKFIKNRDELKFDPSILGNTRSLQNKIDLESDQLSKKYIYKFIFSKDSLTKDEVLNLDSGNFVKLEKDFFQEEILAGYIFSLAKTQNLKDSNDDPVDFESNYNLYISLDIIIKDLKTGKKLVEDSTLEKIDDVNFLKTNDKDIIAWEALNTPQEESEEGIVESLSLYLTQNQRMISDFGNFNKPDPQSFQILKDEISNCPCEEVEIFSEKELRRVTSLIGFFNLPNESFTENVLLGYTSLNNPYELNKKVDEVRLKNMNSSLDDIGILENFTRMTMTNSLTVEEFQFLDDFVDYLVGMRENLLLNKTILAQSIKTVNGFKDYNLMSWQHNQIKNVSEVSTGQIDFRTESKFKIAPDFGIVLIGKSPGEGLVSDVVPYLGFNINLRNIDKNIPMKSMRSKPWNYYITFNSGITLSSIAIENKREDLFSNKSLMGGLGFRLNNYLKLIGGGVFFKKMSTNPLSNKKTIGVSPYYGLSVDFDLKDLFGGINKLVQ